MRFKNELLVCFIAAAASLYARGKTEPITAVNTEYAVCLTAFDVSSLPLSQRITGTVFQNHFFLKLKEINNRARTNEELARYKEAGWSAVYRETSGKLLSKRSERDALLYAGMPGWKYRKERKRIDKDITALSAELEKLNLKKDAWPVIETLPAFKLLEGSPEPPKSGAEDVFLEGRQADAFISGRLRPYYGRIAAEVRLYTRYGSFTHEDITVFSVEDLNPAVDELVYRMENAVSGMDRPVFTVHSSPENTQILVNGLFAESGEAMTLNPGTVSVSVTAEGYGPFSGTLDLASGEKAATDIALHPLNTEMIKLSLPGQTGRVYIGALYAGELQDGLFEFSAPHYQYRYLNVETEDDRASKLIVLAEERTANQEERVLSLKTRPIPKPDEKPVEKRRRQFYGAWGRFWISLPLTVLIDGVAQSYRNAYTSTGSPPMYDPAVTLSNVATGAWITTLVFGAESLARLVLYIYTANREAIPLRR